ncbi:CHAP domain-containing protein [Micromonospora sp. NPDC048830]|uniref:CHAP domain-containing protein n=1 Tax=Micromonospora sp. NPDC048830 TaxID=3364257 RepID=UPI0037108315
MRQVRGISMLTVRATGRPLSAVRRALVVMLLATLSVTLTPAAVRAASGETLLCRSTDYGCLAGTGYSGQSVWGSWGPGHNCVSYAAYRLRANGAGQPWSSIGNANQWDEKARAAGVRVDTTPAVGAIAQWDTGSFGHVAYVEVVTATYVEISEDSYVTDTSGYASRRRLDRGGTTFGSAEFIHVRDVVAPGQPAAPGETQVLAHGTRVNLRWPAASGAAEYQVMRNEVHLATVAGPGFLDTQVSPNQAYTYTVVARNGAGATAGPSRYVQTTGNAADRAYLASGLGPAVCGRAGDQSYQTLVCSIWRPDGWISSSPQGDWGYASDRAWLVNADGTISYCRRVNDGDQARCDRFDGTTWTTATSPRADLGYHENRAYLSTKDGPAVCGRAGDQNSQFLVCNVWKNTGWVTGRYAPPSDWGYATDRAWLTNTDGTLAYCRRVGDGSQALCDRFDGDTWTSSMSPRYDLAYSDNRTYLASGLGPAVCGRAGDQSYQTLVCSIWRPDGWISSSSPQGDWGYASDRAWLVNADGTISYCRRVNDGDQARCDRFDGTTWTTATSPRADLGYHENRAYLSTKDGPAVCGRAGDQNSQFLVCNVWKNTGWVTGRYAPPSDWGYATDRAWLTNTDGTVAYCRRVGDGSQALCDRFDGDTWTSSMSPRYDLGYPDTF